MVLSSEYNRCQHISSVGLAHYSRGFMKCDTVNSERKVFFLHEPRVQLEQWDMTDFFLKGYKHLAVMGLDSRHVILTAPPLLPSTPLQRHPKLRLLWIFFNTLKLSIESVAWTSSFFVTLGL